MARPVSNLRLFVAAYPPLAVAGAMLDALGPLRLPPHRVTRPDQLHLTLRFIGDTPASGLDAVIESVRRAAAGIGAFTLTPLRLVALPEPGPARLIAAETDAPPRLRELRNRLAHRPANTPRVRARQGFRPHLTLARFERITAGWRLEQPLKVDGFNVVSILLMRSTLTREGAEHRPVDEISLDPV